MVKLPSIRLLVFFLMVSLLGVSVAQAKVSRVALIIGNGAYKNIGRLSNPPNDAKLMAKTLRNLDFEVMEVIDSDQRGIKRSIIDFGARLEKAGRDAIGLFFYAGHGVQVRGTNYLIPLDTYIRREADVEIEAVSAQWVLSQMEFAGNRMNVIVLDACRNNPFTRSFRSSSRGLARMDAPQGSILAYATAPGDVAADGKGVNSPYTEALVKALTEPGLKVEAMFKKVRIAVMSATNDQQVPWEASSLTGDFVFKEKPKEVAKPIGPSEEMLFWQSIQGRENTDAYKAYLKKYPDGAFAVLANANIDYLNRQAKLKIEEQQRQNLEAQRKAELEQERLRLDAARREQEARLKAQLEQERLKLEAERTRILSEKDAQGTVELERERFKLEAERHKLLRERQAMEAAQSSMTGPASRQVAMILPPPPDKRVRFGTIKLKRTWATSRTKGGSKKSLYVRYDIFTKDLIQTVREAALHTIFDNGSALRMGESSDVVVESFDDTKEPQVALALTKGIMRYIVKENSPPVTATVRTPAALIKVKSGDFAVEVTDLKETRLVLVNGDGKIASTLGGPLVDVTSGNIYSIPRDIPDVEKDPLQNPSDEPDGIVISFKPDYGLTEHARDPVKDGDAGGHDSAGDDGEGDDGGGDGGH